MKYKHKVRKFENEIGDLEIKSALQLYVSESNVRLLQGIIYAFLSHF